jgi:hypothetical protein
MHTIGISTNTYLLTWLDSKEKDMYGFFSLILIPLQKTFYLVVISNLKKIYQNNTTINNTIEPLKNFFYHELIVQRDFIVIVTYMHILYFDEIHPVYITLS